MPMAMGEPLPRRSRVRPVVADANTEQLAPLPTPGGGTEGEQGALVDDMAFGSEMTASRAAVSSHRSQAAGRGVASSALRFSGLTSVAMQNIVGGLDGLDRSRAAFGSSAAAAGVGVIAGAMDGVISGRSRGLFGGAVAKMASRARGDVNTSTPAEGVPAP